MIHRWLDFNSFVTSSNHLSTSILANSRFVARGWRFDHRGGGELENPTSGQPQTSEVVVEILLEWPKCCGDSWNLIQIYGKSKKLLKFVSSNYGKSCHDSGLCWKLEDSWMRWTSWRCRWLVTLVPYFQTPGGHPPPSRANEPSPNRNKIPRSQNRLMWQSGFTVTAGRPFRVGR